MKRKPTAPILIPVLLISLVGLGLRLYLAFHYVGNYDEVSYEIVANIMRKGGMVYTETARYNYSPIWSYFLLSFSWLSDLTHLPFHFVVRTFLSLVDVADGVLIGLIAATVIPRSFVRAFAFYMLNPVSILIVGYHGQFDNFAALPLLVAVYLAQRNGFSHKGLIWALGTLSLLIKHITLPGVWMLFSFAATPFQAVGALAGSIAALVLTFVPYLPAVSSNILSNVLLYTSGYLQYGFLSFLSRPTVLILFMVVSVLAPAIARNVLKLPFLKSMSFTFLLFLAFAPGIALQYFLLPILFSGYLPDLWLGIYTAFAAFFILGSPDNLSLPLPHFWNTVWVVVVAWLLSFSMTVRKHLLAFANILRANSGSSLFPPKS